MQHLICGQYFLFDVSGHALCRFLEKKVMEQTGFTGNVPESTKPEASLEKGIARFDKQVTFRYCVDRCQTFLELT